MEERARLRIARPAMERGDAAMRKLRRMRPSPARFSDLAHITPVKLCIIGQASDRWIL